MKFVKFSIVSASLLPMFVFAQSTDLAGILDKVDTLLGAIVPIILTLALIFFMWGLVTYIMSAGDEAKRADGKWRMIWGIIALFVMVSVWGLVATLGNVTGVGSEAAPDTTNLIPT